MAQGGETEHSAYTTKFGYFSEGKRQSLLDQKQGHCTLGTSTSQDCSKVRYDGTLCNKNIPFSLYYEAFII